MPRRGKCKVNFAATANYFLRSRSEDGVNLAISRFSGVWLGPAAATTLTKMRNRMLQRGDSS
jgi:hypothetical protein